MKKLLLVLVLFVFGCAGLPYKSYKLEDNIVPHGRTDKVLVSENGAHAKRYGVRFIFENGQTTKIGLYKIVIGDLDGLLTIHHRNKVKGFAGTLLFPMESSNAWKIVEIRRPKYTGEPHEDRKLSERTVQKKDLPNPLNIIPRELFELIESVVTYDNGAYMIIYILPETSLDDVGKLFGFVVKYKEN
jgi:hypothetical protein